MNERKLFQEKKFSKKSFIQFLEKKGFYIVLVICIAIVAGTAFFLSTQGVDTPESDLNTNIVPDLEDDDIASDIDDVLDAGFDDEDAVTSSGDPTSGIAQSAGTAAEDTDIGEAISTGTEEEAAPVAKPQTSGPSKSSTPARQEFIMPVFGEISFDFAQDKLVYSRTLEDWRTHSGIDIAADKGTAVKVAADGVITDVITDPRFGITVIVDHKNGYKTLYANLANADMAEPNKQVKRGDVIGSVGNTASFESAEAPHLHLEVWKDNKPVDPKEYLPLKK